MPFYRAVPGKPHLRGAHDTNNTNLVSGVEVFVHETKPLVNEEPFLGFI